MRFILLITICCIYSSCVTTSYFRTPNDVKKMKGTINMANGTIRKGLISILFEREHMPNTDQIYLATDTGKTQETLTIKDIASYVIDGHTYIPKKINLYLAGEYHFLFVKRLTAEKVRMQLYELHQLDDGSGQGVETSYYFISLPSFQKYEVIDINSNKLIPGFDYKMSSYVADCPDLAVKIRAKQKEYYYTFMSLRPKKLDVIKKIVKEYNECK